MSYEILAARPWFPSGADFIDRAYADTDYRGTGETADRLGACRESSPAYPGLAPGVANPSRPRKRGSAPRLSEMVVASLAQRIPFSFR